MKTMGVIAVLSAKATSLKGVIRTKLNMSAPSMLMISEACVEILIAEKSSLNIQ